MSTDFTIHAHPVLAVACPDCWARAGAWCKRPSAHRAMDLHGSRKREADRVFIEQHGKDAWIERLEPKSWRIHPTGYAGSTAEARGAPAPMQGELAF